MLKPNILLVEDDAMIAMNLEWMVHRIGYRVLGPAATFAAAIAIAEETPPDIALVDLNLADGRTGPMIAEELSESYGTAVIVVSANPEGVVAGEAGVTHILKKPYTDAQLAAAITAVARTLGQEAPGATPDSLST